MFLHIQKYPSNYLKIVNVPGFVLNLSLIFPPPFHQKTLKQNRLVRAWRRTCNTEPNVMHRVRATATGPSTNGGDYGSRVLSRGSSGPGICIGRVDGLVGGRAELCVRRNHGESTGLCTKGAFGKSSDSALRKPDGYDSGRGALRPAHLRGEHRAVHSRAR